MKKILSLFMASAIIFTLAGCEKKRSNKEV